MSTADKMQLIVAEYLVFRRALGFELLKEGQELRRFARFADKVGHAGPITTDLALKWATLPAEADRHYQARRLDAVRRLAQYRAAQEPRTEIPPDRLLGPSSCRRQPHIYSDQEVADLLAAASRLGPKGGLRSHTYVTLFGLLECTGLRISEALALTRGDVDIAAGIVTVVAGKSRRSRLVPLDRSAVSALSGYLDRRDRYRCQGRGHARCDAFFVTEYGTPLKYRKVRATFAALRQGLAWTKGRGARPPRIHDLRHRFAVRCLLRWYQQGLDIDSRIASLSTYLGHAKVSATYWYLTAIPELLAIVVARFEYGARPREEAQ